MLLPSALRRRRVGAGRSRRARTVSSPVADYSGQAKAAQLGLIAPSRMSICAETDSSGSASDAANVA